MHQEIEKLIRLAIADGVVTEKERAVIMRKAEILGEDLDEVELVLDGELAQLAKKVFSTELKTNKEGVLKKCPSCGGTIPSLTLKCNDCGHEFRDTEATKSIKEFYKDLTSAKQEGRYIIISNFPIPNNKEDLLEFLTLAVGNSRELTHAERNVYIENAFMGTWKPELHYIESEIKAWQSKAEAAIMKAKMLFANTPSLLSQTVTFELQFDENKNFRQRGDKSRQKYGAIALGMLMLIMFLLMAMNTCS